jgi:hypothetical protein
MQVQRRKVENPVLPPEIWSVIGAFVSVEDLHAYVHVSKVIQAEMVNYFKTKQHFDLVFNRIFTIDNTLRYHGEQPVCKTYVMNGELKTVFINFMKLMMRCGTPLPLDLNDRYTLLRFYYQKFSREETLKELHVTLWISPLSIMPLNTTSV